MSNSFEYLKRRSFQKIIVQFLRLTIFIYTHTQTHVTLFYSSFEQTFLSPDRSKQTREGIESALTREGDLHRATSAWIKARGRGNKGGGEGGKTRFPNPRWKTRRITAKSARDTEFRRWLVTRDRPSSKQTIVVEKFRNADLSWGENGELT